MPLGIFLGLVKFFRQAYLDLVRSAGLPREEEEGHLRYIERFFDRNEVAVCVSWTAESVSGRVAELRQEHDELSRVYSLVATAKKEWEGRSTASTTCSSWPIRTAGSGGATGRSGSSSGGRTRRSSGSRSTGSFRKPASTWSSPSNDRWNASTSGPGNGSWSATTRSRRSPVAGPGDDRHDPRLDGAEEGRRGAHPEKSPAERGARRAQAQPGQGPPSGEDGVDRAARGRGGPRDQQPDRLHQLQPLHPREISVAHRSVPRRPVRVHRRRRAAGTGRIRSGSSRPASRSTTS